MLQSGLTDHGEVQSATFSHDGLILLTVSLDGEGKLWQGARTMLAFLMILDDACLRGCILPKVSREWTASL